MPDNLPADLNLPADQNSDRPEDCSEQLQALKRRVRHQTRAIAEAQAKSVKQQQQADQLRANLAHYQDQLERLPEAATAADLVAQLQTDTLQAKALCTDLQQRLTDMTLENNELQERPTRQEFLALQSQLHQLQMQLAERPTMEELQEARRRQEVAEAHHLVLKRQYETLQQRLLGLEKECVQAHGYAQTQEKEVALLEAAKHEMQDRLVEAQRQNIQLKASLEQSFASTPYPEVDPDATDVPVEAAPGIPIIALQERVDRTASLAIPPLTLAEPEAQAPSERKLNHRVHALATATKSTGTQSTPTQTVAYPEAKPEHLTQAPGGKQVVDLPFFLRRR